MNTEAIPPVEEQLSRLFGSYKAEWMRERMFELFTEPTYFPELRTPRPCLLVGGRGTGKTTVLRSLSYEGQLALANDDTSTLKNWEYYGLYYRVNTNRVTAFTGPELSDKRWARVFAHYFNLVCCDLLVRFLEWYYKHLPSADQPTPTACRQISASLRIQESSDFSSLSTNIGLGLASFESYVNNIADAESMELSLQGAPIDCILEAIEDLPPFSGKMFFFLIDEYENFLDYQQQVVNTLIKHASGGYSFKIGVRELGWRYRATLNENEQLISPADYVRIDIGERLQGPRFEQFAMGVCRERIARLKLPEGLPLSLEQLLPGLSDEEEASLLDDGAGVMSHALKSLSLEVKDSEQDAFNSLTDLEKYMICFWAVGHDMSLRIAWEDFLANRPTWKSRYNNYSHALLFTIKRGRSGIRKYYAGWNILVRLASGNIRYLLELLDNTLLRHLQNGNGLHQPVDPKIQTLAAQNVGRKNLSELEGLSVHGAQLTKLLLGLGRVFQAMAADAAGHMLEANHFHMADPNADDETEVEGAVSELLTAAVMHLALLRFPGSKASDETDTRDYDYMIHPIFSPFFCISHRRKRKIILNGRQILGLVNEPRRTIREVLASSGRSDDDVLPEQLRLFEGFYGITSR